MRQLVIANMLVAVVTAKANTSSMGRRVVPIIDAALRAKVEAAAAKKLKAKVLVHLFILMGLLQCGIVITV